MIFLSVATGYPGSLHDSRVLRNLKSFQRAENDTILAVPTDVIKNTEISPLLIADSAYGSKKWLISPYNDANLHVEERRFNRELSKSRSSVKRAFGLLKARWRCLLKHLDNYLENINQVVITCFVLHNMCEVSGDAFIDDEGLLDYLIRPERDHRRLQTEQRHIVHPIAAQVRNALKTHVNNNI